MKLTQHCRSTIHQFKNVEKETLGYFLAYSFIYSRYPECLWHVTLPRHWGRRRQQKVADNKESDHSISTQLVKSVLQKVGAHLQIYRQDTTFPKSRQG